MTLAQWLKNGIAAAPTAITPVAGQALVGNGTNFVLTPVLTGAGRVQYQYGNDVAVPGGGAGVTLQMLGAGNATAGYRMNRAASISGASLQVNSADATRTYDFEILINGVIVATLSLPLATLGVSSVALAVAVAVGDRITCQLKRTNAVAGASTFSSEAAMVEITF